MRKSAQASNRSSVKLSEQVEKRSDKSRTPRVRPGRPRVVAWLLAACFLLVLAALVPLVGMENVYAESNCLLLCPPTATPTPGVSPTPTSRPRPTPTTKPTATPTAKPTVTPTAKTSASPTPPVVITEAIQTPVGSSGVTPPPTRKSSAHQSEQNVILLIVVVAVSVVFALLLSLGGGWLFVRRALVPPLDPKLPPSGARPWSRFRIPNPASLLPNSDMRRAPGRENNVFAINNAPGDFHVDVLANHVSGGVSHGPWSIVPGDTRLISPGNGATSLADVDTNRFPPVYSNRTPGERDGFLSAAATDGFPATQSSLHGNQLAPSQADVPGAPEPFQGQRRGLITRAPYYTKQATGN